MSDTDRPGAAVSADVELPELDQRAGRSEAGTVRGDSERQRMATCWRYPHGGGSYIVASDSLGPRSGLGRAVANPA